MSLLLFLFFFKSLTCPIVLLISVWGNELLLVSPGAGGKEPCIPWCLSTEDVVLFSSSSSSSDAEPSKDSANENSSVKRLNPDGKNQGSEHKRYQCERKTLFYNRGNKMMRPAGCKNTTLCLQLLPRSRDKYYFKGLMTTRELNSEWGDVWKWWLKNPVQIPWKKKLFSTRAGTVKFTFLRALLKAAFLINHKSSHCAKIFRLSDGLASLIF